MEKQLQQKMSKNMEYPHDEQSTAQILVDSLMEWDVMHKMKALNNKCEALSTYPRLISVKNKNSFVSNRKIRCYVATAKQQMSIDQPYHSGKIHNVTIDGNQMHD